MMPYFRSAFDLSRCYIISCLLTSIVTEWYDVILDECKLITRSEHFDVSPDGARVFMNISKRSCGQMPLVAFKIRYIYWHCSVNFIHLSSVVSLVVWGTTELRRSSPRYIQLNLTDHDDRNTNTHVIPRVSPPVWCTRLRDSRRMRCASPL